MSEKNLAEVMLNSEEKIVFCNFNANFKNTPDMFSVWTNIMKKFPIVIWLLKTKEKIGMENIWDEAEKRYK